MDGRKMGHEKRTRNRIHEPVDIILFSLEKHDREFISYWFYVMKNLMTQEYAFAKKMIETPKIVFTKTLNKSEWIKYRYCNRRSEGRN